MQASIQGYLVDLDGTLYAGGSALPGAAKALQRLRQRQVPFRLVTNTTSRSRSMLLQRLTDYGFDVQLEEIFTATLAGRDMARAAGYQSVAPFTPKPALEDLDPLELVGGTSGRTARAVPDAVLIGDLGDRWDYGLMQEAFEYLMNGADLIAFSKDRYWLRDDRLALDAGPFVTGLEFASGKAARVAGKPSREFFHAAVESLVCPPHLVAMVGDDLWSDVQGAQRAGLQGWLVRTGKFRPGMLSNSGIQPDRILDSIAALE